MHSATKYLNGHSDLIAGALCFARDDALSARARSPPVARPDPPSIRGVPFDPRLEDARLARARLSRQRDGTRDRLSNHAPCQPCFIRPAHHPGHEIASRQMQGGFGGMLSICCAAAGRCDRDRRAGQLWKRATSLGGVESLIEHRASIEGPGSPCPTDLLGSRRESRTSRTSGAISTRR